MTGSNRHLNRLWSTAEWILSSIIIFTVIIFTAWLYFRVSVELTPFDTDEADHANAAIELYTWISRGDLANIAESVSRQAFYPPLHSFFVAASYFVLGPSIPSSRTPTVIIFAAYLILLTTALFWYTRRACSASHLPLSLALLSSSAVLLIAATSPITLDNAVLCMLELPGMALTALLLFYSVRISQSEPPGTRQAITLALIAAATFLVKYNFGIIVIPAVAAGIAAKFELAGLASRLKSASIYTIACGAMLLGWYAVTDRPSMHHFFVGHKSYAPILSQENLFFEIRSWLFSYCSSTITAAIATLLAISGAILRWKSFSVRLAACTVLCALAILVLSTTNEERHFIIALPFILFLTGVGLQVASSLVITKFPARRGLATLFCLIIMVPTVYFWALGNSGLEERLRVAFEGKPQYHRALEFIVENIDPKKPALINGVSDNLGIEALRWMTAARYQMAYSEVQLESYPFRDDKHFTARMRNRNIDGPWKLKDFKRKPFQAVIDQGYYGSAAQITKLDIKQRFRKEAEEFAQVLEPFRTAQLKTAEAVITIYHPQSGGSAAQPETPGNSIEKNLVNQ